MRALLYVALLAAAPAHAEVSVGAAVGAGAQGTSTYSALELRLDGTWRRGRIGLGLRGVWDDAEFRGREWTSGWDAVAVIRDVRVHGRLGDTRLALAAGGLAPAHVGTLADGYRVALDDRWRTGIRGVARSTTLDAQLEIDDVLDPALIGASASWLMAPPWGMHGSVATDPGTATAIEAGAHRRIEADRARAELGVSVVAEISRGASVVAFANTAIERANMRFTFRGDLRAGTGSVGGMFGPLWRVERLRLAEQAGEGVGAGATVGVVAQSGWLELGARTRPELGRLVVVGAGAPMGRWVQAAMWAAVARDDAAGAAEIRVAWANRLFSALQAARIYRLSDVMEPAPIWSVTAWFGAASR